MRHRFGAGVAVVIAVTASACAPGMGTLTVVRGTSVGLPPGYAMAVVSTTGSRIWNASAGPVHDGPSGNVLAGSAKPGVYHVKVAYFLCDQQCLAAAETPSVIPSRVQAAPISCDAEVKVERGKTTQVTAAYENGTATCVPTQAR